ncbi:unnamed protein product, partial [Allacma fusca]
MKFATTLLVLFGMLAAAHAGILAGPVVYSGAPVVHAAPISYASHAAVYSPYYHGAPVLYGSPFAKTAPVLEG